MKTLSLVPSVKATETVDQSMISALDAEVSQLRAAGSPADVIAATARIIEQARAIGAAALGPRVSAKEAVLTWLEINRGNPVSLSELEAATGSNEATRRLRELRADGWPIVGGNLVRTTSDQRALARCGIPHLDKGSYVLVSKRRRSLAA